jgi:hypothetical protein
MTSRPPDREISYGEEDHTPSGDVGHGIELGRHSDSIREDTITVEMGYLPATYGALGYSKIDVIRNVDQ